MEKLFIGIYGGVNSGKSSLINLLAGQDIAIVSPTAGTTTDAVKKPIELTGIGSTVLIDTAGGNDNTALGPARAAATLRTLDIIDMAIIVADSGFLTQQDLDLITSLKIRKTPFFIINNKADLPGFKPLEGALSFSAAKAQNADEILALIRKHKPAYTGQKQILLDDLIAPGDIVVLVTPIDAAAPQGRLILPQVNAIRNILDNRATAVVLQPGELAAFLKSGAKIKLIVTDSQVFKEVNEIVPPQIPLTSFSILFARLKGELPLYLEGANAINNLKDGDKVLILESCSHSANTCDDIGRVKLPALLQKKTGKKLEFKIIPGLDPLPANLANYALAVQCGGCMVTRAQLAARIERVKEAKTPITNYGIAIAYCTGILERVTRVFGF